MLSLLLAATPLLVGAAVAQSPSPAQLCATQWNELKVANKTGDQTYREFAQKCMAQASTAGAEQKPADSAPTQSAPPSTPTGSSAKEAQPSIKQCADLWNEMKANRQTGKQTYRDFARDCLAGSTVQPAENTAGKQEAPAPSVKEGEQKPKPAPKSTSSTSVPSVAARPTPDPAPTLAREPNNDDREAVNRCNTEWQDYKTRHKLTGAKAWHVFMARCLP